MNNPEIANTFVNVAGNNAVTFTKVRSLTGRRNVLDAVLIANETEPAVTFIRVRKGWVIADEANITFNLEADSLDQKVAKVDALIGAPTGDFVLLDEAGEQVGPSSFDAETPDDTGAGC